MEGIKYKKVYVEVPFIICFILKFIFLLIFTCLESRVNIQTGNSTEVTQFFVDPDKIYF